MTTFIIRYAGPQQPVVVIEQYEFQYSEAEE